MRFRNKAHIRGKVENAAFRLLPDAIDSILICLEAGQSLSQSITLTAEHFEPVSIIIADELATLNREISVGRDRGEALQDLARRQKHPDVCRLASVLNQSSTLGIPISDSLRWLAAEMREKMISEVEERVNTMSTKMTLATMCLTVPPLILILVGPSIYEVYQTLTSYP